MACGPGSARGARAAAGTARASSVDERVERRGVDLVGVAVETVGIRTSACSLPTARSVTAARLGHGAQRGLATARPSPGAAALTAERPSADGLEPCAPARPAVHERPRCRPRAGTPASREPARRPRPRRVADGDRADRVEGRRGCRTPRATAAIRVRRDAEEAGAQALVDRGLQDQQAGHRRRRCARTAPASGPRRGRSSPCRARRSGRGRPPCCEHGRITSTGARHHARAASGPGRRPVVGGGAPRSGVRRRACRARRKRPALAEARRSARGSRCASARSTTAGSTGSVGVVADHPAAAYDAPGTPWCRQSWAGPRLTTSSGCGPTSRRSAGRRASGGYFRQPFTAAERELRAPGSSSSARARGLRGRGRRFGNVVALVGPDVGVRDPRAVLTGSHLDSVLDGGAYDGPLGVVSALAAVDLLRERGVRAGAADRGRGVRRGGGVALRAGLPGLAAGRPARSPGSRRASCATATASRSATSWPAGPAAPAAAGPASACFVELHVEQGRDLVDRGAAVGVASGIWPHGRYRFDFTGEANHAGADRGWRTGATRC